MNNPSLRAIVVLSFVTFAAVAHAETYHGVLARPIERARLEVVQEARDAAREPVTGEAFYAGHTAVAVGQFSRESVRGGALASMRSGTPHPDYAGSTVLTVQKRNGVNDPLRAAPRQVPSALGDRG
jgi:hypothetical protein